MVEVVYQKGDGQKYRGRKDITKVVVASDVDEIAEYAFSGCSSVTEFNFGDKIEINVEMINNYTFYDCNNLVKVVLKEGVTTVESEAFSGCPNISTFIWPDSVKEVGDGVFQGCDKLHELAGSKDQEKVIEYLKKVTKSMTPLMKLCFNDGKLEDIKMILDENSEAIKNKDLYNREVFEAMIGDRSLGRDDTLNETMMAAFRETDVKGLESAVEEFAKSPEIFDLFAWQQFLEIHHRNNPDPGYFVVELQLLFDATWTVLTEANPKTDEASKTLTENLKGVIQKYVSDNNSERPNLLLELLTAVPMKKLQKLAATRIFRAHLDSYMRSGIMYIYYLEVFLYVVFTVIFTWLSIKFKFSTNGTYEWDNIVIRDMTIACFSLALYFLLRELAQFHAMYQLNLQRNWFKDFWNYIDLVASGGTIVLLEYYFRIGPGTEHEHFASVIALFVWMKVLGFAKAFSQPIATFVLMLNTIFRDLFSFMAVLVIILVMFGHAFYLVLTRNEDRDELVELDFTTIGGTAWSLYLMILGTFESSVFAGIWAQSLSLCYSFLVVIILLNVLIAIVSDSYDAVLVTSTELFWRSRLELVAEITTTFKWLLQLDLKIVKEWFEGSAYNVFSQIKVLYGLDPDHKWSNRKSKVALVLRVLFSPILLGIGFVLCCLYINNFWYFVFFAALNWRDQAFVNDRVKYWVATIYGFGENHANKDNKLLLIARIIFSPLLLAVTICFFLLWYLPYATLATILGDRSKSSSNVKLDLKLDSSNSDWSGRVLDIVRRVNAITSSESAKTNAKITALDGVVLTLKEENSSLKKLLTEKMDRDDKRTRDLQKMLLAIATKVDAEVELLEDEEDQQVEETKNDDPDEPLGKEVELEDEDTREGGQLSSVSSGAGIESKKKTQTHADVAAPKDEEGGRESVSNPMIEPVAVQKKASKTTGGGTRSAKKKGSGVGRVGEPKRGVLGGQEALATTNCKQSTTIKGK
ncbi:hypothetical protein TrVE_jg10324 [Triparma verrucosa]|uniref:Ion transport domain-containing protein n=1 Tax=Triparma verrucosa TaxID=1606542 RepID=A0A9W7BQW3_9STRA|nr:hypothetical protein TrVE_jg10324 [Triparma verrucosa]